MKFISFWKNLKQNNKTLLIYASISLGFLFWMFFLDTHSWRIHSELNQEIEKLEKEKKVLKETLKKDNQAIDILNNTILTHTVARNGSTIQGLSEDLVINESGVEFKIWYTGSTWSLF